ncbi:hypothetical protein BDV97DRAFT_168904 [Delphinella strobiligena]|nr:hypothetical protein BDV97DRAFT_168904 [Delphinella strobiligena]
MIKVIFAFHVLICLSTVPVLLRQGNKRHGFSAPHSMYTEVCHSFSPLPFPSQFITRRDTRSRFFIERPSINPSRPVMFVFRIENLPSELILHSLS